MEGEGRKSEKRERFIEANYNGVLLPTRVSKG